MITACVVLTIVCKYFMFAERAESLKHWRYMNFINIIEKKSHNTLNEKLQFSSHSIFNSNQFIISWFFSSLWPCSRWEWRCNLKCPVLQPIYNLFVCVLVLGEAYLYALFIWEMFFTYLTLDLAKDALRVSEMCLTVYSD